MKHTWIIACVALIIGGHIGSTLSGMQNNDKIETHTCPICQMEKQAADIIKCPTKGSGTGHAICCHDCLSGTYDFKNGKDAYKKQAQNAPLHIECETCKSNVCIGTKEKLLPVGIAKEVQSQEPVKRGTVNTSHQPPVIVSDPELEKAKSNFVSSVLEPLKELGFPNETIGLYKDQFLPHVFSRESLHNFSTNACLLINSLKGFVNSLKLYQTETIKKLCVLFAPVNIGADQDPWDILLGSINQVNSILMSTKT